MLTFATVFAHPAHTSSVIRVTLFSLICSGVRRAEAGVNTEVQDVHKHCADERRHYLIVLRPHNAAVSSCDPLEGPWPDGSLTPQLKYLPLCVCACVCVRTCACALNKSSDVPESSLASHVSHRMFHPLMTLHPQAILAVCLVSEWVPRLHHGPLCPLAVGAW